MQYEENHAIMDKPVFDDLTGLTNAQLRDLRGKLIEENKKRKQQKQPVKVKKIHEQVTLILQLIQELKGITLGNVSRFDILRETIEEELDRLSMKNYEKNAEDVEPRKIIITEKERGNPPKQ